MFFIYLYYFILLFSVVTVKCVTFDVNPGSVVDLFCCLHLKINL